MSSTIITQNLSDLKNWIGQRKVINFIGASSQGYSDNIAITNICKNYIFTIKRQHNLNDNQIVIGYGATPDGLGGIVYPLAKSLGFATVGITSNRSIEWGHSQYCDFIYSIDENKDVYGGFAPNPQSLTLDSLTNTSRAVLQNSDYLVVVGGGGIGAAETLVAMKLATQTSLILMTSIINGVEYLPGKKLYISRSEEIKISPQFVDKKYNKNQFIYKYISNGELIDILTEIKKKNLSKDKDIITLYQRVVAARGLLMEWAKTHTNEDTGEIKEILGIN